MAKNKQNLNGFLLILLICLAIFSVYSYSNTSSTDKEYYYEFSSLDLLNTSHEVVNGEEYESLRINNYSGSQNFLLEAPSSDLENISRYTIEYAYDVSELNESDDVSFILSQDSQLTQNETLRASVDYATNGEYFSVLVNGQATSLLASDNIIGGRNSVSENKFKVIHEVNLENDLASTNTIISTLVDGETIVLKQFSTISDVSKDNGETLALDRNGNIALVLFDTWNGIDSVQMSENSSMIIDYIKVYDIE